MTHEADMERVRSNIEEHLDDLSELIETETDQSRLREYEAQFQSIKTAYERDFDRKYLR